MSPAPLAELLGISKHFGGVAALQDVSLQLRAGEVLALVGENGAGKSTLMNVLSGLYRPDAGEVRLGGERVVLKSPRDAIARGVGMVHQHFMLVPTLSVAENVVLGREPTRHGLLDVARAEADVAATCARFGFALDPRARVGSLGVGSQQKVEIVKALHREARVLVLDEPTAVLTPQEAADLFRVARALAAEGRAVVFIGHKLREVLAVADRVVVLRRGRLAGEARAADASPEGLAAMMVGEGAAHAAVAPPPAGVARAAAEGAAAHLGVAPETPPELPRARGAGPVLARLEGVVAAGEDGRRALAGVSLEVRGGEILGIAGVDGNGQRELAEVLTGLRPFSAGAGELLGGPLAGLTPAAARARGVGHVPEDRLRRAVVKGFSVEENVALGRHAAPPFARRGLLDFRGRRARALKLLEAYDVRPPDPTLPVAALSGGNQQKVVVARELDAAPRLVVVVQPTRGLDVGAVAAVHARLRAARDAGAAVVLVSLDLDEVLALSDRLYVLAGGRVTGHFERAAFDAQEIGRRMTGAGEAA